MQSRYCEKSIHRRSWKEHWNGALHISLLACHRARLLQRLLPPVITLWTIIGINSAIADELPPFTVADGIAMTRLVNPDLSAGRIPDYSMTRLPVFRFAPDGRKVAIVVHRGDLESGRDEYKLVLLDTSEVLAFVNSKMASVFPKLRAVASFSIDAEYDASDRDAIDQIRWLPDSQSIAFIGRASDGRGQMYEYVLDTGELRQLVNHPDDVASFSISAQRNRVVFSAYTPPDWNERNVRGYVVSPKDGFNPYLLSKTSPQEAATLNVRYFVADLSNQTVKPLDLDPEQDMIRTQRREIVISPDGTLAVIPIMVRQIPAHWAEYAFVCEALVATASVEKTAFGDCSRYASTHADEVELPDAFAAPNPIWTQYYLVDLLSGAARPLVDAPTMRLGTDHRITAQWSPDGSRVLLPPTLLPLVGSPEVRKARRTLQAVAEVDVATGQVWPVMNAIEYGAIKTEGPQLLTEVDWDSNRQIRARYLVKDGKVGSKLTGLIKTLEKRDNTWVSTASVRAAHAPPGGSQSRKLMLHIVEDYDVPPEVAALDLQTGAERIITNLNPGFRSRALSRLEEFSWTDRFGRQWTSGLLLPPHYERGRRYPIVIQTDRFARKFFLVDGGNESSSPMAARALAGRGMLVLQMGRYRLSASELAEVELNKTKFRLPDTHEQSIFLAHLEDVIDALDASGYIDRDRVGVIGFSIMGMMVQHAITFSRYKLAAATITDAMGLTPWCYAMTYGTAYPGGMTFFEEGGLADTNIGASLWGDGVSEWVRSSYLFHLSSIETPIRFEHYGSRVMPCTWETFAILSRHQRPVEFFHLPVASHNLTAPRAMYASKQANVDWFAFWLRDEEDPDPAKVAQYQRWRDLREKRKPMHPAPGPYSEPSLR